MGLAEEASYFGGEDLLGEEASEDSPQDIPRVSIEEVLLENPHVPSSNTYYLVYIEDSEEEGELQFPSSKGAELGEEQAGSPCSREGIPRVLNLLTTPICTSRPPSIEPLVDYSKSILLTSDAYFLQMQQLVAKYNDAAKSRDARKVASEEQKWKHEEERTLQLQKKKECDEARAEKARKRAYWAEVATRGWGNELQIGMKSSLPPPLEAYISMYVGSVPVWCIANQRR